MVAHHIPEFTIRNPAKDPFYAREVVEATLKYGFLLFDDPRVDPNLVARVKELGREMGRRQQELMKYVVPWTLYERGFCPHGFEKAFDQPIGLADLKIAWNIRDPNMSRPERCPWGPNVFPDAEIPDLRATTLMLFASMQNLFLHTLRCFEVALGVKPGTFVDMTEASESLARLIHYPALRNFPNVDPNAMRSAPHTDINWRTNIPEPERDIEIYVDGHWGPIHLRKRNLTLSNNGDMEQAIMRLHGLDPIPTLHRVVNSDDPDQDRNSFVHFGHTGDEVPLGYVLVDGKLTKRSAVSWKMYRIDGLNPIPDSYTTDFPEAFLDYGRRGMLDEIPRLHSKYLAFEAEAPTA